ncbi:cysteine hydrolase [Pseudomonas sp. TKO26]|uniref:cysteine hydrolase family protein n=1 Tax=unclassified Pseudomonas TaxID=196821 RepID=UPI000D997540|nr:MULTISPECIES: cysteine hydrolase family protein [unclassified Pseudomonas]PYY82187.1 cysteine hydrolase [Pseudomonas sp. TKO30]PYY83651.1 cysteine hydrolase [Pseudomonas sp. TKO29]PYY85608.1 cysteine hydrolase [Pseudomonas sp. TKO26]
MPLSNAKRALLVIDMQVGLFNGPDKPYKRAQVLENINQLIRRARQAGAPIFAVRHTGPAESPIAAGSPFWQLLPNLEVDEELDSVLDKTRPSCFVGTGLVERLQEAQVKELVIVGMKTQYCVDATCRAAGDLGFAALLVEDAHTCMDTPALGAKKIIAHHNATLNGPFVRLVKTPDVPF